MKNVSDILVYNCTSLYRGPFQEKKVDMIIGRASHVII